MSDAERQQFLQIIASQTETLQGLRAEISELNRKLDAALRQLHAKKSERQRQAGKMAPVKKALGLRACSEQSALKRAENKQTLQRQAVDAGQTEHEVPAEAQVCGHCGEHADFRPVGIGKERELFEYVPGYFRKSRHVIHTVACTCGQTILSAQGPDRATPKSKYGPGLAAWLVTQKCLLSMPVHRIEKMLRSHGVPVSRSTLNELLLRTANRLHPIYEQLVQQVRHADIVLADETPLKLMSHDKLAYVWVFIGDEAIVYRFSCSRASTTPAQVLGATAGTLLTDDYSGYKPITDGTRTAAGCLAHIRRKFHEALPTAPHAQQALDWILQVYRLEAEVKADGIAGTAKHLRLRQKRAGPAMGQLKKWMRQTAQVTPPKSPLGVAIAHTLRRWKAMVRFLYDPALPIDNNRSERALRVVALGRKNFYGAGSKEGGHALAILYSLLATCEAAGVEPFAYLRDVIVRIERDDPKTLTPAAWVATTR